MKNETVMRDVSSLRPDKLSRPVSERRVETLRAEIASQGLLEPLVIDERDNVLDGVQRLEACRRLGHRQVPCQVVDRPDYYANLKLE